ncbi:EAL domain-containing protein [Pseudoduganella albidiflava]|uniref:cyclic-guanylate-specific phosphodiesterase n=1 Tax=Pseudoduganella albidiflava TaxID=321983 RepID=A0A411X0C7_9BURK|nr:EAL domain-containing protein [Pseudoduganella albidiflava]QBI02402.1 EAL domain-containing protein [Pseudoduganella albidiflava]GGY43111.1 diguanylate phosphodiesterase [Pseudoduganella albidiflava]
MGKRALFGTTLLAAAIAALVPPWLAYREAEYQAYRTEADFALGYARDLMRRVDETGSQAFRGIEQLAKSGYPPCSAQSQELMRRIDLSSTYIQAIGYVRGGVLACSSMGDHSLALGTRTFRTSRGVLIHTEVPLGKDSSSPLIGIQRGDYAALFHRDLPLDTWTAVPDVSLAALHLEMRDSGTPMTNRGYVDRSWLARLENRREVTFLTGQYLVAVVRSDKYLNAGVAAVPRAHLDRRTAAAAMRLVPAGTVAGLALALAILLLARRQMSIANALRHALRKDEFFLLYQPIVELATGKWVGAEALLRWRRATGELIGPDLFIPIAEQTGTITKLTGRVIRLVQRDAGRFLVDFPGFHIALNLSASDLRSTAIVDLLDRLLAQTGARPANLIVELTERALLDIGSARKVISALRKRGIEVAVDDFGTGYSSLSYLESLELDYLKIDRSFIEAIGTRAPTSQVVSHIIRMADAMGLRMIAEGVETQAQADFLIANGVQYAQGWLFAKPISFDELSRALDGTLPERADRLAAGQ